MLLGPMPRILRDLVHEIVAHERDLEVVGELEGERLVEEAARVAAQFVIVAVDDPHSTDEYLELLERSPRIRILALSGDGRDAEVWELHPRRLPLGEISPTTLLDAIRAPDWRAAGVV